MRRRYLSFGAWLCLALSMLLALGTGKVAEMISAPLYQRHLEAHAPVEGEIGGPADENTFQAQTVEDLLSHDTFTVMSHGIQYRNRGAGYYGGKYLQALTLPSGELVAAWINEESVQQVNGTDYFTSDKRLPLGRVVYEDLTAEESFLHQIEYSEPLSRRDFYVDMVGDTAVLSEEYALETPKLLTQVATVFIAFPLLHMLGSKLGLFQAYFSFRKKKPEWE